VVVSVVFIVWTIVSDGPSGDFFALALWTELWVMLSVTVWIVLFAGHAIVRAVRHAGNLS
jgi:hypothetical protein